MNASFEFQKDEKSIQGSTELPLFSTSFHFFMCTNILQWVGQETVAILPFSDGLHYPLQLHHKFENREKLILMLEG
jgi:hypothetical protein